MKKFVSLVAAASLSMTLAATSFARETTAPGQSCAGLKGLAKVHCMRGVIMDKKTTQMQNVVDKKGERMMGGQLVKVMTKITRRGVKILQRERQRNGYTNTSVKSILKPYVPPVSSTSSSMSSSSATSSSAGTSSSAASSSTSSSMSSSSASSN